MENFIKNNKLRLFIVLVVLGNALFLENHLMNLKKAYENLENSELCESPGTTEAYIEYILTENRLNYGFGGLGTIIFMSGFFYLIYDPNAAREMQKGRQIADIRLKKLSDKLKGINLTNEDENLSNYLKQIKKLDIHSFKPMAYKIVLDLLRAKPLNDEVRDCVFEFCMKASTGFSYHGRHNRFRSEDLYNATLEILEKHPKESSLKSYCLKVGRWHYSQKRMLRKINANDEQAIQNDIDVRA